MSNTPDNVEPVGSYSPRDAQRKCGEGALLLDIREEYLNQFKRFDVPLVLQIPLSQLASQYHLLPTDRLIIVADSSGLHANEALLLLKEKGFRQLASLAGGLVEWERDGMPLVTDKHQQLSGSCACQLRARDVDDRGAGSDSGVGKSENRGHHDG